MSEPGVTRGAHLSHWVQLPGMLAVAEIHLKRLEMQAVGAALEQDKGQHSSGPGIDLGISKTQSWKHREVVRAKAFSRHQGANKNRQHEN